MDNYSSKIIVGDSNSDFSSEKPDAHFVNSIIEESSIYTIPYGSTYHMENVSFVLLTQKIQSSTFGKSMFLSQTGTIS